MCYKNVEPAVVKMLCEWYGARQVLLHCQESSRSKTRGSTDHYDFQVQLLKELSKIPNLLQVFGRCLFHLKFKSK